MRSIDTAARASRKSRSSMFTSIPAARRSSGPCTRRKWLRNRGTNLMHREELPINRTLRCGAQTRSGKPCRSPAVRGKRRCRMHGGAAGSGAPMGNKSALKHGHYSAEAIVRRSGLAELIRQSRALWLSWTSEDSNSAAVGRACSVGVASYEVISSVHGVVPPLFSYPQPSCVSSY
jgi:hypothetical protein